MEHMSSMTPVPRSDSTKDAQFGPAVLAGMPPSASPAAFGTDVASHDLAPASAVAQIQVLQVIPIRYMHWNFSMYSHVVYKILEQICLTCSSRTQVKSREGSLLSMSPLISAWDAPTADVNVPRRTFAKRVSFLAGMA